MDCLKLERSRGRIKLARAGEDEKKKDLQLENWEDYIDVEARPANSHNSINEQHHSTPSTPPCPSSPTAEIRHAPGQPGKPAILADRPILQ